MMDTEPSKTKSSEHRYFQWRAFFRFGIMYFVVRVVVALASKKPIGGEGGWSGVVWLAIEVVITSFLFSLSWQALINWRRKKD
jgi:hypothetical protein